MANEEHLAILKQGVEVWNEWREENPNIWPNLDGVELMGANLSEGDFYRTSFLGTNLSGAQLRRANLTESMLMGANLSNISVLDGGSFFQHPKDMGTDLSYANLKDANLIGANFRSANLRYTDLSGTLLEWANLSGMDLNGADLRAAVVGWTIFVTLDLSETKGLETVEHSGPSVIGVDTISRSKGKIPEIFLRGCGLSDWEIENAKLYREGLSSKEINDILYRVHDLRIGQSIQISPLFISYSHADSDFVDVMEEHLDQRGIRFWRDVHHATAGRLEKQIDRAIRHNPTVLLVLSENSVKSDWVQHEARLARQLEIETGRDVLCPVALDDSWKTCRWPERLREQIMEYNVLDFSGWEDEETFERMFGRLIDGLDLFYE